MTAEPSRVSPPRTWPGGVQVIGPILRIPGRTLFACREDLEEAVRHAESVMDAVAALRRDYPERHRG